MNLTNALVSKLGRKDIHPDTLALAQLADAHKLNTEAHLNELTRRIEALERQSSSVTREGTTILDR